MGLELGYENYRIQNNECIREDTTARENDKQRLEVKRCKAG